MEIDNMAKKVQKVPSFLLFKWVGYHNNITIVIAVGVGTLTWFIASSMFIIVKIDTERMNRLYRVVEGRLHCSTPPHLLLVRCYYCKATIDNSDNL